MNEKTFNRWEIMGAPSAFLIWLALCRFDFYESGGLLSVLFGCANNSVWECEKPALLACVFWALIELCAAKPAFKPFVAAKTLALYISGGVYALVCTALELLGVEFGSVFRLASAAALAVGFHIISRLLVLKCGGVGNYYIPCLFLLLLFAAMYVCFTLYPPRLALFFDFENNLYGIIPPNFDKGALCLDNMYGN